MEETRVPLHARSPKRRLPAALKKAGEAWRAEVARHKVGSYFTYHGKKYHKTSRYFAKKTRGSPKKRSPKR